MSDGPSPTLAALAVLSQQQQEQARLLAALLDEARRTADSLARIEARTAPSTQRAAPQGDPKPKRCTACGERFTPARGWEKLCDPCFSLQRSAQRHSPPVAEDEIPY